jgi:hypothetical protein
MDEIMKIFREIAYEGRKVRLLNLYKGIPVSYAAGITCIGEASISVSTEKIQLVSMYIAKETYIQSVKFPQLVRAEVMLVSPNKMDALLSHFSYHPANPGELTRVCIQPAEPLHSRVSTSRIGPLQAELTDISMNEIGVLVDEDSIKDDCQLGIELTLQLQLPGMGAPEQPAECDDDDHPQAVALKGKITDIKIGLPEGKRRLGVELDPKHPARLDVARFISKRELELLREVHALYELMQHENPAVN